MTNTLITEFLGQKTYVSKKETCFYAMLKLKTSKHTHKPVRKPLNISFSIDVSGSMNEKIPGETLFSALTKGYWTYKPSVFRSDIIPSIPLWAQNDNVSPYIDYRNPDCCPGPDYVWVTERQYPIYASKLSKVKEAVVEAINKLDDHDTFSIVTFSDKARVIQQSLKATSANKKNAISMIGGLTANGGTALHDGWRVSAEQVCQALSTSTVNRVLLLTDGEANIGVKDTDTLCAHTNGLLNHKVSTSTFGVGQGFNEDLLKSMSDSGGGQYYYLDDADSMCAAFDEEFSGLSNLFATNVLLSATSNVGTLEVLNDFKCVDGKTQVPNITYGRDINVLVKITYNETEIKKLKELKVSANISYELSNSKLTSSAVDCIVPVGTSKQVAGAVDNVDVAKAILTFEAALAKRDAMRALDTGDYQTSNSILRGATQMLAASAYSSELQGETLALNTLVALSDSGADNNKLRKTALYQAYNNDRSKTI